MIYPLMIDITHYILRIELLIYGNFILLMIFFLFEKISFNACSSIYEFEIKL